MTIWMVLALIVLAFALAALAVPVTTRLAHRFGMLDSPARHKTHDQAIPLLGGCAIFAAILLPSLLGLAVACVWSAKGTPSWLPLELAIHVRGAATRAPMALGILLGAGALHVMGLIDDRHNLGALTKFVVQVLVCALVATFCDVRILTVAGPVLSVIVTTLWLVAITNAFNFLDNMDGLSVGVAAICAAALVGSAATMGQMFVLGWGAVLLGSLLGFLPYNFPPARVYMGDAGSLVVGFLLGVVSCLTTYVQPGETYYLYGIFVPLILMAVPLYDMVSVIVLRLRARANPFVGDQRHFSHRLLRRGMSVRTAVMTVYLCTAATAMAASLLPHVRSNAGAMLLFGQTVTMLSIVAVLETADKKP
jgi:UDP-GlcNAc:undecaprenyl-phosphate GlcNAc-1-phosphate transferase